MKKKEQRVFVITNQLLGHEIRTFVREAIIPELVEAVRDKSVKHDLKKALGITGSEEE